MHQAGYFDHLSRGQFAAFEGITDRGATDFAREHQHLIVGPWGHSSTVLAQYGDWDFGAASSIDLDDYSLRFLDLWLKDIDDGVSGEPKVRYFLIGENRWCSASTWPPDGAEGVAWYLDSDGEARGNGSHGRLSRTECSSEHADSYRYDPTDPVRTNGGQVYWGLSELVPVGPTDQRATLTREDVLLYRSEPLERPMTVVGPVNLELWVSTTAEDTDFIAKLCVVEPLGAVTVLTLGSLRCRYRSSRSAPEPMGKGEPARIDIQMNHIAYTFAAGSRIALMVTSSCFPRILPHTNRYEPTWQGGPPIVATETVHHGGAYGSKLKLAVLTAE
jgi:putative CocE/NonD family hydrolase